MDNQVLQALRGRRSVRKYQTKPVEEEKLQAIVEAGKYAPSGMNRQPGVMVVVQDPETREQLRKMNAQIIGNPEADPFYGAPVVIVVLAKADVPTRVEDGALLMGNLMNAAHAVGVDSCWIHRAKEEFESEEGKALLKKWGIEGEYVGIGHCILGYCDGERPEAKERKANYIVRV